MVFTLGNLLTIGVVLIILIVYRQLDRNNRSLDKVKKFSDKMIEEIDGFVEQRTTEMKDIAIEVEVHQKAAKEVFKRIKEAEDTLGSRASDIENMHARISQYDQALSELVNMTARVDENLKRIREESEYVDKVGKNIKEFSVKLQQVERSIPGLVDEFGKRNDQNFSALQEALFKETQSRIAKIGNEIGSTEKRIKEFGETLVQFDKKREMREQEAEKKLSAIADALEKKADAHVQTLSARMDTKVSKYKETFDAVEKDYQSRLEKVAEKAKTLQHDVFNLLKEQIREDGQALKADLKQVKEDIQKDFKGESARISEQLEVFSREVLDFERTLKDRIESLEGSVGTLEISNRSRLEEIAHQAESSIDVLSQDLAKRLSKVQADSDKLIKEHVKAVQEELQEVNALKQEIVSRSEEVRAQLAKDVELITKNMKEFSTDFATKLQRSKEEVETAVIASIEKQLEDYERTIEHRFKKLEDIGGDIDDLEKNLRLTMERITAKVQEDFNAFARQLEERRRQDRDQAEEQMKAIYASMNELESGLNELKSRAYENVSEKLKVFEDDFFSDLTVRGESMNKRLEEWQAERIKELEALGAKSEEDRARIERSYAEELKARLAELSQRLYQSLEKTEQQVSDYQNNLDERMNATRIALSELQDSLKEELEEIQQASRSLFEKEFTQHTISLGESMKKYEREIEVRLKSLSEDVETGRKEHAAMLEASKSDVAVWQAKVLQEMKEAEADVSVHFTTLKAEVAGTIGNLRDDFNAQREELIVQTHEERSRLKEELQHIGIGVNQLSEELKKRSEQALEAFAKDYDAFILDFQKKARELQTDADQRMKDFRNSVQETREKIDAVQKKLYGKVEENYKVLSVNMQEIDKKLKNFIAQTKIFDRADSLKIDLEANIEDLKAGLAKAESYQKELKEIEAQFVKIQKLSEESSVKLARFMAEKRRIEIMEGDFKKLINISQAIDVRLEQVTNSHDTLQDVQAKIRNIEELGKQLDAMYERLEKKRVVMDATAEGVEKNFQLLEKFEEGLKNMEGDVIRIPSQIEEIQRRIEVLAANKEKADAAASLITNIDTVLHDLEERMDSMQKARQWLASTETRLEEISRQAQEQVKLLSSIVKNEMKQGKREKGAPPMDIRETVTRLAHEGWKIEEIAKVTKLSRGEVELILELAPKS